MEREFSTPYASLLKHHSEGEVVSDTDSDVDSPDPSTNAHHGMFMLDMSPIDKREEEMVSNFVSMSCGCKLGSNNDACSNQFSKDHFSFYRNNCSEMSCHELDLIILTAISCSRSPPGDSSCNAKTKYTIYLHQGVHICMKTFLFLHTISRLRLNNLQSHYDKNGVTPRIHGNTHRAPKHTTSMKDTKKAVSFITNMASIHALPLAGRNPTNKDERFLLLLYDITKAYVYRKYRDACTEEHTIPFQRRKFETVWNETLPYIVTAGPASDLCFVCQQNKTLISKSVNMPLSVKSLRLPQAQEHLERAHREQSHYNSLCKLDDSASNPTIMHYSYDYAQNVHYPYTPQQSVAAYFKTARKCGIFGVVCEPMSFQVNYLIDEA